MASQQNGIVFANPNILVSVSLSGTLNLFDTRESSSTKWRTLHGATKAITSSVLSEQEKTFYTGSFDGSVKAFKVAEDEGACSAVEGTGHSALVSAMTSDGSKVYSAGWDDKISSISGSTFASTSTTTKAQPAGVAATAAAVYTASAAGLEITALSGGSSTHAGTFTAVAAKSGSAGDLVAFGSGKKVTLATVNGGSVKIEKEFEDNKGDVLSLAFSDDGALLAAGDASGRIVLIDVQQQTALVTSRWTFHTGRVNALSFSPNSKRLASAGADESIYIWEVEKLMKNTPIKVSL